MWAGGGVIYLDISLLLICVTKLFKMSALLLSSQALQHSWGARVCKTPTFGFYLFPTEIWESPPVTYSIYDPLKRTHSNIFCHSNPSSSRIWDFVDVWLDVFHVNKIVFLLLFSLFFYPSLWYSYSQREKIKLLGWAGCGGVVYEYHLYL